MPTAAQLQEDLATLVLEEQLVRLRDTLTSLSTKKRFFCAPERL